MQYLLYEFTLLMYAITLMSNERKDEYCNNWQNK